MTKGSERNIYQSKEIIPKTFCLTSFGPKLDKWAILLPKRGVKVFLIFWFVLDQAKMNNVVDKSVLRFTAIPSF